MTQTAPRDTNNPSFPVQSFSFFQPDSAPSPPSIETPPRIASLPPVIPSSSVSDAPIPSNMESPPSQQEVMRGNYQVMITALSLSLGMPLVEPFLPFLYNAATSFIQSIPPNIMVPAIMGASAFTQALTGFGFSIVAMGSLAQLGWIQNSSIFSDLPPVAAVFSLGVCASIVLPQANRVPWKTLAPLLASSLLTAPLGAYLLQHEDATSLLHALGALIVAFVAFLLSGKAAPAWAQGNTGAILCGSIAGIFGGAFNAQGPAIMLFAASSDWKVDEIRRNVLAVLMVNSSAVVLTHLLSGQFESFYSQSFLLTSIPCVVLGMIAGNWMNSKMDSTCFKNFILASCALMGSRLLIL
eukprot:CAMPEP_0182452012 /NCGR_PEP_ID=MMETSP1172-20130603/44022_1 /TAXON_ID=708627 /ORGANISM="Timspurckia oligopyrenoides, Strain CCMP3278" /LENGTH=353 /DNA_ID=CAMNT_0024649823 /DNA_START=190 /DNA_END=1251 /DNA_ORIENTATION=+